MSHRNIYPEQLKHLKAHGFTEEEIRQVEEHCNAAEQSEQTNGTRAAVLLNGACRWSSAAMAEILDSLRPGIWVNRLKEGEHAEECPCCGENQKRLPEDEPTREAWSELEQKLLSMGGRRVVWVGKEDSLEELLTRGHSFEQAMTFLAMPLESCHENAAVTWGKDVENTKLIYGYGLCRDGLWRHHGWAVKNGTLLETNLPMDRYFGIELSQQQSLESWMGNFLFYHYPIPGPALDRCLRMYPQVKELLLKAAKKEKRKKRKSLRAVFNR